MSLSPIQNNGYIRSARQMNSTGSRATQGASFNAQQQYSNYPTQGTDNNLGQQYQQVDNGYSNNSYSPQDFPDSSASPDNYQPSPSNSLPASPPPRNPNQGWTLTENPIVTPIVNWFNELPTWAKWITGISVAFLGLWAGKYVGKNASTWSKQVFRSFGPTPLGSIETKEAKYSLQDARAETRRLKAEHERLTDSIEAQDDLVRSTRAAYDSHMKSQGKLRNIASIFGFRGGEGNRLYAEHLAAGEAQRLEVDRYNALDRELKQSAKRQVDAHLELMKNATSAMVLKRQEQLATLKQRLTEAVHSAENTKGEDRALVYATANLLEEQIKAAEFRLAESRQIAASVRAVRPSNENEIYTTPTAGLTIKKGKGKSRQVMTGGLAIDDKDRKLWMENNPQEKLKEATSSFLKNPDGRTYRIGIDGNPIPGTGTIGFLPSKSTRDSGAFGLTRRIMSVVERRRLADGTWSEAENIGGPYIYPIKKFWGLFGQSDWWKFPLGALTDVNVKTAVTV